MAMQRYQDRLRRLESVVASGAPENLLVYFRRMLTDAAFAVTISRPVLENSKYDLEDPDSEINRAVRHDLASHGHELTPMDLVNQRVKSYQALRELMRASGHPVPNDDQAMLEWMWYLNLSRRRQTDER